MLNRFVMMVFALTAAMARSEQRGMDEFPSLAAVDVALREINQEFLSGEKGKDTWSGFARIAAAVAQHQCEASADTVLTIERTIISRFVIYSFACEYDDDRAKADFGSRLESVRHFCNFTAVRSDTNIVFKLADWLGSATRLAVDRGAECAELAEACKRDALMIYGGKQPPRYPGSSGNASHWGPVARQCQEKFRFRRLYNDRLTTFRIAALAAMRGAIMKGYRDRPAGDREAMWSEFCCRAKATSEERKQAQE